MDLDVRVSVCSKFGGVRLLPQGHYAAYRDIRKSIVSHSLQGL